VLQTLHQLEQIQNHLRLALLRLAATASFGGAVLQLLKPARWLQSEDL
jgi:hypothetical protein